MKERNHEEIINLVDSLYGIGREFHNNRNILWRAARVLKNLDPKRFRRIEEERWRAITVKLRCPISTENCKVDFSADCADCSDVIVEEVKK